MGATNVSFTMKGSATRAEVKKRFEREQEEGTYMNGHDPYNGTFSTIQNVKFHDHKLFDNESDAEDYCLEYAQKWDYAIAVKYTDDKGELQWLVAGWAAE